MSVTGRTLSSVSQSPATGLHSAALVPGLGANAQFTVCMAFKDPGGNTNNTIWADDNGGCQIFINSSTGRVSARYSNTGSGGFYTTYTVGEWVFLAVRMGLDISGGVNDVVLEAYDAVLGYEIAEGNSSGGGGPSIETDSRHYALGDDAGTAVTDDGTEVKVFGLALVDGLWTLDQLGCDTATGQAKDFDPAAEAALVYALRGLTSVGNDDSGNGNHFTVENGGVVFDEADLPPGVSLPSSGVSLTAAGVSAAAEIGATALAQTHALEGEGLVAASEVGAAVLAQTHALTAAGLAVVAAIGSADLSVRHALSPAGWDASAEVGVPTLSQGQATGLDGVEVEAEVGSPAIAQRHALSAAGLEGVADLGVAGVAQVHSLVPIGLPITSEIGSATLTQDHIVAATGVEASTQVGNPVVASFSGLLGVGVEIAAVVGAPAIVQRHSLTPAVPGVGAEVGAAVLTQVHSLSAFSIVTASEIGSPVVRDASQPSLVVIEISGAPAAGLSVAGRPAPPVVSIGGPNDIAFIIGGL
ncbi:hypothetical protein [Pseudooceanicola sp.]|uniref:hypothetical protein n=1 Tax=Pseudooceanicola sp. TaxID=1914328 RepID=UPI003513D7A2